MRSRRLLVAAGLMLVLAALAIDGFLRSRDDARRSDDPSAARSSEGAPERASPEPRRAAGAAALSRPFDGTVDLALELPSGTPLPAAFRATLREGDRESSWIVRVDDLGPKGVEVTSDAEPAGASLDAAPRRAALREVAGDTVVLRAFGVAEGRCEADASRVDVGGPPLRAGAVVFEVPATRRATLALLPPGDQGLVVVTLRGDASLRSARVEAAKVETRDVVAAAELRPPGHGAAGEGVLVGSLVLPSGVALRVAVTDFVPGAEAVGLPAPQVVTVGARKVERVDVEVPPSVLVSFRALDPASEPIPFGLSIWRATPAPAGETETRPRRPVPVSVVPTAGSTSRVKQVRLRAGRYLALAAPQVRYSPSWATVDAVGEAVEVRFDLVERGIRARLEVTLADGAPLPLARVNLNRVSESLDGAFALATTTDERGRIATPFVPPGTYRFVSWESRWSRLVDLDSDEVRRVVLPEPDPPASGSAALSGTIATSERAPAAFATVLLERADGWGRVADADGGGRYAFDRVLPGAYRLEVPWTWWSRTDHAPWAGEVTLEEGRVATRDVVLEPSR
jgi:hypothetical protein